VQAPDASMQAFFVVSGGGGAAAARHRYEQSQAYPVIGFIISKSAAAKSCFTITNRTGESQGANQANVFLCFPFFRVAKLAMPALAPTPIPIFGGRK